MLLAFILAPLSSSLCNVFGFKIIMIIGSVMSCIGFVLAYFTITFFGFFGFYFTYGIIGGFGLGLMYLPMSIAPGLWFDTKRPLAVGIATCGTGIGMIVIPFILEYLTTYFHYRNLNFVITALMFVNVISALFLRPAPIIEIEVDNTKDGEPSKGITALEFIGHSQYRLKERTLSSIPSIRFLKNDKKNSKQFSRSTISLIKFKRKKLLSIYSYFNEDEGCCKRFWCWCRCKRGFRPRGYRPMYKTDIFYYGSIHRFDKQLLTQNVDTAVEYSMHVYHLPTKKDVEEQTCKVCCPESLVRTISNMANIKLFKSPSFLLYCGSGLCFYVVVTVPILFLNSFIMQKVKDLDPRHINWLVPFMGLGLFLGRLGGGILLQLLPTLSALSLCSVINIIISTSTFLQSIFVCYPFYFIYSFLYGLCFGLYGSLRNLVLVDYVGLDNLTPATGILFAIAGISNLVGPPLAIEITVGGQNMEMAFYFSSLMFTVSTLCLVPLFFMKKVI